MREYSRAEKINQYQETVLSGELDLTALRKKLEVENIGDEEVAIIVRYMSNQLLRAEEKKARRVQGKNIMQGGFLLAFTGVFLTLATYFGWIDLGKFYLVAYGPFFFGLLLVFKGRNMMNL